MATVILAVMSISVFAAEFVPSIEAKKAPDTEDYIINGVKYSVVFVDSTTRELTGGILYSDDGRLKFISIADNSVAEDKRAELEEAYNTIKAAENIKVLSADVGEGIEKRIAEFNTAHNDNITVDDLVLSDLFEAYLEGTIVIPVGNDIRFETKPIASGNDFYAVIFKAPGGDWMLIDDVKMNDNGFLEITAPGPGIFAFVTEKDSDLPVDPHGPDSPQTGNKNEFNFLYIGVAALCVGAAAFFFSEAKKRRKA